MRASPINNRPVIAVQSAATGQPVVKTYLPFCHCCTTTGYVPQTRTPSFFQRIRSFFARLRYRSNYLLDYLKYKLGGTEHLTGLDVVNHPDALPALLKEGNTYLLEKHLDDHASIEVKLVCAHFRTQDKKTQAKNARFFAHHKLCLCAIDKHQQQTPLIIAAKENDWPLCQAILGSIENPPTDWLNKKDINQKTAMMYAIENNNPKLVGILLEKGANKCWTDFITAVKAGQIDIVKKYIQHRAVSLDTQDQDGMNALMYATRRGNQEMVKLLIDNGADLTLKNTKDGKTAATYAIENGNQKLIDLLSIKGAGCWTDFITAVKAGQIDIVKKYIQHRAVSLDTQDQDGMNALMYAARCGNQEMVKLLIDNGADLTLKNHADNSALQLAQEKQHNHVAKFIYHKMVQELKIISP